MPGDKRNFSKDNLLHKIIGTYIKHVDGTAHMENNIDISCDSDKHKEESTWKKEILWTGAVFAGKYEKKA